MAETTTPSTPQSDAGSETKGRKERIYPQVGEALVKARREAGMTQDQLAASSGVSRITIARIEQAHINPSFRTLEALAHGMDRRLTISFDE
ncbi:helix-turn-helix domain-containing protein [Bifidobacterium vansinderenii]|uniref:Transcriptional regulator n=1 Tax=Bifidobacterium vansinderenii TaxID=1984871 RepID=A0A229W1J9_9BIFI|nr:helix-turn-helix transcriptional regulator [Bifidobacterium vansinderenii]OXN01706.1 transcriptional regulator [Bifidobacterium vansinderenii]